MHGMAVNVERESEAHFGGIVPCGIEGAEVGSVEGVWGRGGVGGFKLYLDEAFREVFQCEICGA